MNNDNDIYSFLKIMGEKKILKNIITILLFSYSVRNALFYKSICRSNKYLSIKSFLNII